MHGLLFVRSRNNQELPGYNATMQPVLAAKTISVGVPAPGNYCRDFELMKLLSAVDDGLAEFGRRYGLVLSFSFRAPGKDLTPGLRQKAPAEAGASLPVVGA